MAQAFQVSVDVIETTPVDSWLIRIYQLDSGALVLTTTATTFPVALTVPVSSVIPLVVLVQPNITAIWGAGRSITSGARVLPVVETATGWFEATTSGITGNSEPVWPVTDGQTVNDNGVIWVRKGPILQPQAISPALPVGVFVPSVRLLLHFDGANNSTSILSDGNTFSVSVDRGAVLTTAQQKFGTASLQLGAGANLVIPYSESLDPGAVDFTVATFMRPTAYTAAHSMIAGTYTFGAVEGGTSNSGWFLGLTPTGQITFGYGQNGGFNTVFTTSLTVALNVWTHVAVCRSGSTIRCFIGGVQAASATLSSDMTIVRQYFRIGSYARSDGTSFGSSISYTGQLDEFLFERGVAYYTSAFTPPTAPY